MELITVQLTQQQARALHSAASMFSQMVSEANPEWETHLEGDEPPALTTGILALETVIMLGAL